MSGDDGAIKSILENIYMYYTYIAIYIKESNIWGILAEKAWSRQLCARLQDIGDIYISLLFQRKDYTSEQDNICRACSTGHT